MLMLTLINDADAQDLPALQAEFSPLAELLGIDEEDVRQMVGAGSIPPDLIISDGAAEGLAGSWFGAFAPSQDEIVARHESYLERIEAAYGPEVDPGLAIERGFIDPLFPDADRDAGSDPATPLTMCLAENHVPEVPVESSDSGGGGGGAWAACEEGYNELVFGTDNRTQVSTPNSYPYTKFPLITLASLDQPDVEDVRSQCTGVWLDEETVLTAAHCVYNTTVNGWRYSHDDEEWRSTEFGMDRLMGYVCIGNAYTGGSWVFSDECEFVSQRIITSNWVNQSDATSTGAAQHDFAIIKVARNNFPGGLGAGRWMALSIIDDPAVLESKTPVNHGYPGLRPNDSSNRTYGFFDMYSQDGQLTPGYAAGMWQYRNTAGGVLTATTSTLLKTQVDSAQGQSGGPIFYYSDNTYSYTGQAHWIIGLMTTMRNPQVGIDWTGGPTVGQFRSFAETYSDP